jgi:hypothetical protein
MGQTSVRRDTGVTSCEHCNAQILHKNVISCTRGLRSTVQREPRVLEAELEFLFLEGIKR